MGSLRTLEKRPGDTYSQRTLEKRATDTASKKPVDFGVNLIRQIMKGEGTSDAQARRAGYKSGYDVPYGYGKYTTPPKDLTDMTVGEVKDYQRKQINATKGKVPGTKLGSGAVGAYQVVQGTLIDAQRKLGFSDDEKFTPELQDAIGKWLLDRRGYGAYKSALESGDEDAIAKTRFNFQRGLAKEWASIADPETGKSRYGQHTGTSLDDLRKAIGF